MLTNNPQERNWNKEATAILKAQLSRQNMKYHDLARALNNMGIEENQNTIATKMSRGSFSFAFFLQCMYALRVNTIDLNLGEY
jgi:DNA (cytosine-5)-methyltransferase 1